MKLYNSLTNAHYDFTQLKGKRINWYCCGPTVYNDSHLGHARTYIIFDTMIRYLRSQGYAIEYGMNITDIDDKIINKVNQLNDSNQDYGKKYELFEDFISQQTQSFWDDMKALGNAKPQVNLTVSDNDVLNSIKGFIAKLVETGYAYVGLDKSPNRSVYFDVSKYSNDFAFNCLNCANYCDQITKNTHAHDKKSPKDFALWKAVHDPKELAWTFNRTGLELGRGRPGWHIECSTIMKLMFGSNVHIHSGGIDLKYPHHNNEFLQSTSYFQKHDWIQCFVHSGHLQINGEKMSQSLGNFITIKQFLTKYNSNEIRLMFLSTKYSAQMDLNDQIIKYGQVTWSRIKNFMINLDTNIKNPNKTSNEFAFAFALDDVKEKLNIFLSDDFNTPEAIKLITNTIDTMYEGKFAYTNLTDIHNFFSNFLKILGLDNKKIVENFSSDITPGLVDTIGQIRNDIKQIAKSVDKETKDKLFALTDKIRDEYLPNVHIKLEDLPDGKTQWYVNY